MATRKIQKVVVAGINGTLGPSVMKNLQASNFDLTILSRDRSRTIGAWGTNLNVVEVDYSSRSQLVTALKGHDAVISLISRLDPDTQNAVADAAVEAGVYRIIPSCFGTNHRLADTRNNPALLPKVAMEEHVEQLAAAGRITFTGINTGAFLDWALRKGIFVNAHGVTPVFNGGDIPFSVSLMDHIGKAVVAALQRPEQTENKYFSIHSAVATQNKLLGLAREVRPEHEFKVIELNTEQLRANSQAAYDRGERSADALRGFLAHLTFGQRLGLFEKPDNEALGIPVLSDAELKEVVKGVVDEVLSGKESKPISWDGQRLATQKA